MSIPGLARAVVIWFSVALTLVLLALFVPKLGLAAILGVAQMIPMLLLPVAVPGWLAARAPGRWGWAQLAVQATSVLTMVYAVWVMAAHPDAQFGIALLFWDVGLLMLAGLVWLAQSIAGRLG